MTLELSKILLSHLSGQQKFGDMHQMCEGMVASNKPLYVIFLFKKIVIFMATDFGLV